MIKTERSYNNALITFLVLLIIPASQLAIDMYLPSLPAMVRSLNSTSTALQLSFTFYLIGLCIAQLFYGPIADRLGRRPVILFGLSLFFVSSLGCGLANSVIMLLLARLCQGLGGGACFVIANAILADVFTGSALARRVTYGSLTWSLVPIIAPVIGGFVQQYINWQTNFYIIAGYTLVALIFVLFCLPETLNKSDLQVVSMKQVFTNYWIMLINSRFLALIFCVIFSYGAVITFNIVGPFILQNLLHVSASMYGIYVLIVGLAYSVGIFLNSQALRFYKGISLLSFGIGITVLSGLLLLLFSLIGWFDVASVLIATCLLQIGQGFMFANCLTGCLSTFPKLGGTVGSFFGSVVMLGMVFISGVIARLPVMNQFYLALTYVVLGVLCIVSMIPYVYARVAKTTD